MELTLNQYTVHQALALQSILSTMDRVSEAECAITRENWQVTKPIYEEAYAAFKGAQLRCEELGIPDPITAAREYNRLCFEVRTLEACLKKEVGAPLTTKDKFRLLWEKKNEACLESKALVCRKHKARQSFFFPQAAAPRPRVIVERDGGQFVAFVTLDGQTYVGRGDTLELARAALTVQLP